MCVKLLKFILREGMGTSSFFIDEHSRFGYLYLVHGKSDALDKFIEFKAESGNLLDKHIKSFRLDRGGVSSRFDSLHKKHEIRSYCVH